MADFIQTNLFSHLITALYCGILAVLFLQSGFDKVFNFKGNLEWLNGHFAGSLFSSAVPLLLGILLLLELLSGFTAALAIPAVLAGYGNGLAQVSAVLSLISFLCLFTGQRIAKDYAGAASLMPYITFVLAGLYIIRVL
jgi:hypothetical protein